MLGSKHKCKPKPLFAWIVGILRLTGFYIEFDENDATRFTKVLSTMSKIYCFVGNVLLWLNVLRYVTIFIDDDRLSGSLMSSLALLCTWMMAAYMSTTVSLTLPKTLRRTLKFIEDHRHKSGNKEDYFKHLKKIVTILGFIALCGMAMATFALSGTSENILPSLRRHITPVTYLEGTAYTVGIAFYYLMLSFFGIHACGTVLFFAVMATCLYKEFSFLAKEFEAIMMASVRDTEHVNVVTSQDVYKTERTVPGNKGLKHVSQTVALESVEETLQRLLEGHQRMRQIMTMCNKYLCHIIAGAYLFIMPIVCFLLYGIINGGMSYDEWVFDSINGVLNVGYLVIITVSGIVINDKMSLFLTCLTTQQIGFSAYGLFVVDRSTTLMVCGTILTYAIVVLQLNPSS